MGLRRTLRHISNVRSNHSVDLEADDVYRILQARRRRQLLVILDEHEANAVSHCELAEILAAQEQGVEPDGTSVEGYEAVYVSIYQSHLPVLEQHDVVEWRREDSLVRPGEAVTGLVEVVCHVQDRTEDGSY